jgi:hypothetical protein
MNPPSENHSTVTDNTQDWIVEKFQLGKIKTQRCSSLAASMIWVMTRPRLLARHVASVIMPVCQIRCPA